MRPPEPETPDEPQAADDAAWAGVVARWDDESTHRHYLARHPGLEGLAHAGARYRAALDARPGDPVALRWRDEVLRRATALALAQLPRTAPTRPPRAAVAWGPRRVALALAVLLVLAAVAWLALSGGRP
jgi:hypothetical protein